MRRPVCESKYFARLGSEGREHSLVPLLESNSTDTEEAPAPPVTIKTEMFLDAIASLQFSMLVRHYHIANCQSI